MIDFACKQFDLRDIIKCSLGLTRSDIQVFDHLLAHKGSRSSEEIAGKLKLDLSTVQRAVKKLHEKGLLVRMQTNLDGGGYVFAYRVQEKRAIRKIILDIVAKWTGRVEQELESW